MSNLIAYFVLIFNPHLHDVINEKYFNYSSEYAVFFLFFAVHFYHNTTNKDVKTNDYYFSDFYQRIIYK